jgi:hypothetical protein
MDGVSSITITSRQSKELCICPQEERLMCSRLVLLLFFSFALASEQEDNALLLSGIVDNRRMSELSCDIVVFYAVGNTPYGVRERQRFSSQLGRLDLRPEFLVHLGNVRERQQDCFPPHLDQAAAILKKGSRIPTFVLPGEADWYTCLDQESSWEQWSSIFVRFEDNWNHKLNVRHQVDTPENFSFIHKDVLFVSFHVLNTTVVDWGVWQEKVNANIQWLKSEVASNALHDDVGAVVLMAHALPHNRRYRDFYNAVVQVLSQITKPIMFLYGDGDAFSVSRDLQLHNVLRVSVAKGGDEDPLQITVDPCGENPFILKRRPYK